MTVGKTPGSVPQVHAIHAIHEPNHLFLEIHL
ncbi:hypothetical protein DSC45_21080 [Streptomyces sp. YIM 130001]|nr:hypothetical protein DSC45_21080 [Streptomyces sp. YIM 130001]